MTTPNTLAYRPDIDGLRAVAVLLVAFFHAIPSRLPGGFIGVDVFFVISGFLITGIILADARAGRFTLVDFYFRRCRRILPALAVVLAATWLLGAATLMAIEFENLGRHVVAGATFTSNLLLWTEAGYFDGPAAFKPLLHLWSLGIEEQFYLVWPLLLAALVAGTQRLRGVTAAILLVSFAASVVVTGTAPAAAFYLLPTRLWELLAGALLAVAAGSRTPGPAAQQVMATSGLVLITGAAFVFDGGQPYPGWRAAVPVAATAMLIAAPASWINRRLLSLRAAVGIGLVSYPFYLWHWPLLSIFDIVDEQFLIRSAVEKVIRLAIVALALGLAIVTYRYVELPVQARLRNLPANRQAKLRVITALVAIVFAVGVFGGFTVAAGGFVGRHPVRNPVSYAADSADLSQDAFTEYLNQFPACPARYRVLDELWCHQSGHNARLIAVVGDSHARSLFPGLAEAIEQRGMMSAVLMARCAPLVGVRVADQPECEAVNRRLTEVIAAEPAIETVVLTSRGPLYTSGSGFGPVEADVGKRMVPLEEGGDGNRAGLFFGGIHRFMEPLIAAGKRVVFVINVPELGFSPEDCLAARPFQFRAGALRSPCAVERSAMMERQREYREQLQRLRQSVPGMVVFDPAERLCDDNWCYAELDGRYLYTNNNHIGVGGSRLVGADLAALLENLPVIAVSATPPESR